MKLTWKFDSGEQPVLSSRQISSVIFMSYEGLGTMCIRILRLASREVLVCIYSICYVVHLKIKIFKCKWYVATLALVQWYASCVSRLIALLRGLPMILFMMLDRRYVLSLAKASLTCFVARSMCSFIWEGDVVNHRLQCGC